MLLVSGRDVVIGKEVPISGIPYDMAVGLKFTDWDG